MNVGHSKAVVVVGAGPAGLLAAIAAARQGARVQVLEQMDRPGLKLLASGGGRCNLTNTLPAADYPARFGRQGRFLAPSLTACGPDRLREFFAELGVRTHSPDGFHVYPVTDSAATVLAALLQELERCAVPVRLGMKVTSLVYAVGNLQGVRAAGAAIPAEAVVLAAGGCSYPELGGTGGGYALAQAAGHALVAPVPALVPLVTRETWPGELAGVSLAQARLELDLPRRSRPAVQGALLFTHRGLSGPAVLDLSGAVAELLAQGSVAPLRLSLLPGASAASLHGLMGLWHSAQGRRSVARLLAEEGLPQALARSVVRLAGLAADRTAAQLTASERRALVGCLTACPLTVTATEGFARAMVTRGGVALREVAPATLASRKMPGLFFAGEVLDLDGPCGGFNLQWAFASGWLAGRRAAQAS
ncbi:MAG: NAD(P)/FAD-dependent oxidoreductase [Kiritimatiellaeota bacterium]|nr:NAD(P)/FAD-dependent oxidoreductase [Kiritimatiellota bacterium]